jgi:transglutaminase-like putative cysteine protease
VNYKITHATTYSYTAPVSVCHNTLMLTPRESRQVACHTHRLTIRPTPVVSNRRKDLFGNLVHAISIEENHRQLVIHASCKVSVLDVTLPEYESSPAWEEVAAAVKEQTDPNWLSVCPFVFDSPRISRSRVFAAYAAESFIEGRPILSATADLTARIHRDFEYNKKATDVNTTTADAFHLKQGVCQDFAHIFVCCLRSIGLPARYVSGYLRTIPPAGKPRLQGADQSHAWGAVYCGPELDWIDFDPTNNCAAGNDHIPIAWGRDYGDVVPIKGVFLGGGEHTLQVSVDVCPI